MSTNDQYNRYKIQRIDSNIALNGNIKLHNTQIDGDIIIDGTVTAIDPDGTTRTMHHDVSLETPDRGESFLEIKSKAEVTLEPLGPGGVGEFNLNDIVFYKEPIKTLGLRGDSLFYTYDISSIGLTLTCNGTSGTTREIGARQAIQIQYTKKTSGDRVGYVGRIAILTNSMPADFLAQVQAGYSIALQDRNNDSANMTFGVRGFFPQLH